MFLLIDYLILFCLLICLPVYLWLFSQCKSPFSSPFFLILLSHSLFPPFSLLLPPILLSLSLISPLFDSSFIFYSLVLYIKIYWYCTAVIFNISALLSFLLLEFFSLVKLIFPRPSFQALFFSYFNIARVLTSVS